MTSEEEASAHVDCFLRTSQMTIEEIQAAERRYEADRIRGPGGTTK